MKLTQSWVGFTDEYGHSIERKEIKLTHEEAVNALEAAWRLTTAIACSGVFPIGSTTKLSALSEMIGITIDSIEDYQEVSK